MKPELAQLIALQKNDSRIKYLQTNITNIPSRRAEIEKDFATRAAEIQDIENRHATAVKERRRLETEIADNKTKASRAERNLMASRKTDDYTAAIREADVARKNIAKLEEKVLEQMVAVEETEAKLQERAPEIALLRAELDKNLAAFEALIQQEQAELETLRQERETMRQNVAAPTLRTYERLVNRLRDGVAVAAVRKGACTSCFMSVRPQAMSELRTAATIFTCENCTRILYLEQE